jgi:hypothetical protein
MDRTTSGVELNTFEFRAIDDLKRISGHPDRPAMGALYVVSDP